MKEAKEVYGRELREFAEVLGTKGFESDRDITTLGLRLDLVIVTIHIERNSKGNFKQISCSIRPNFLDYNTRGIERVFKVKPLKGLSIIYVDECITIAQNIQNTFRAAFAAASNQVGLIDTKGIIARKKEVSNAIQ